MLLKENIAVVTGASRGIGFAVSRLFAMQGAHVIMTGRQITALNLVKAQILDAFPDAQLTVIEMDVTKADSVRDAFQAVFKLTKRLDILVANAGVLDSALIGMVTPKILQHTFETNIFGAIYCAQYASRLMVRNNHGSIINMASIMGTNGSAGQTVYAASKAAVIGATKSLAKELAAQNIRVNAIAPGFIDTDMARTTITKDKYQERLNSIAMQRIGTADEVASVALFLASNLSSYMTGQVIGVDGGMLI